MFTLSVVVSFRIPKKLKEELEKFGVDYTIEVKAFLEELVRKKKAEKLKFEMDKLREGIGQIEGNLSVKFIREDRDKR